MGLFERLRESKADRATRRAARDYSRQVDEWLGRVGFVARRSLAAHENSTGPASSPVQLAAGEHLLMWWNGATLIAPRNARVTNWTSASHRVGERTTVRAGTARTTSTVDQPTPIDRGSLTITDQRVVFLGATRTVDWQFRRLIGVSHDPQCRWTALHVSNRQRLHGFGYPRAHADDVDFYLSLAMAKFSGEGEPFAAALDAEFEQLVARPPEAPTGTTVDPRVSNLLAKAVGSTPAAPPALIATQTLLEKLEQLQRSLVRHLGFARTDPAHLEAAISAGGFLVSVDIESHGSPRNPVEVESELTATRDAEKRQWIAVVAGSESFVARFLDELQSPLAVVVCAESTVLDDLDIPEVDKEDREPVTLGYSNRSFADVQAMLESEGMNVLAARGLRADSANDWPKVLDAAAHFARHMKPVPQAVLVSGVAQVLRPFIGTMRGIDTLALCSERSTLVELGVGVADETLAKGDLEAPLESGSSPPLTVAQHEIVNPLDAVLRYLADHGGTVANYDLQERSTDVVTPELIRSTRSPWMNSRISEAQGQWFVDRAANAPWELVERDAELADADPTVVGGLYDKAEELYNYFMSAAPKGVSVAKVSKVLHLLRPRLYPILDSRLTAMYDRDAAQAARDVARERPDFARYKRLDWAAVRNDLLSGREALDELRSGLRQSNAPLATQAAEHLSDVRLLDMLAWAAAGGVDDDS